MGVKCRFKSFHLAGSEACSVLLILLNGLAPKSPINDLG